MNTKHTPGPWRDDAGRILAGYAEHKETIAITQRVESNDEMHANARLIAAAPDLLAELKNWIAHETAYGDKARIPAGALAAVEKAEADNA